MSMIYNDYNSPPISLLRSVAPSSAAGDNTKNVLPLADIIESGAFDHAPQFSAAIGNDGHGQATLWNFDESAHILMGGSAGSGKSICLHAIITSLMYKCGPNDARFILVDSKRAEFDVYEGVPHLLFDKVLASYAEVYRALRYLVAQMEKRYKLFYECECRNIKEYNESSEVRSGKEKRLPHLFLIVDEISIVAELQRFHELEDFIFKLGPKSRSSGIHLILATNRVSSDIITGTVKMSLMDRIAFKVHDPLSSQIILDLRGAEDLGSRGEMIVEASYPTEPKKVKGAYVSQDEIKAVVGYIKQNNRCEFDSAAEHEIADGAFAENITIDETNGTKAESDEPRKCVPHCADDGGTLSGDSGKLADALDRSDPLAVSILKYFVEQRKASLSMAIRRFSIGYARAARIIDQLENSGYITPSDGSSKPRDVLISQEKFEQTFGNIVNERTSEHKPLNALEFAAAMQRARHAQESVAKPVLPKFRRPMFENEESEKLFVKVLEYIVNAGKATTADVQYAVGIKYTKTLRIFEILESSGYIKADSDGDAYQAQITEAELRELFGDHLQ